MGIEDDYKKAKAIVNAYEAKLKEVHTVTNLETLFYELRKRTHNVKCELRTVEFHIAGFFDNLILGHQYGSSCHWYMYIHDYTRCVSQNPQFPNNVKLTLMFNSNFALEIWGETLDEVLQAVQAYYLTKKDDLEFANKFQTYYLDLKDILEGKTEYLL